MREAAVFTKWREPYNGHRFAEALAACGFRLTDRPSRNPRKGDVLVIWNRYASVEPFAQAYEAIGGAVLVVENAYFGRNWRGTQWYALALSQHNGPGSWPSGDSARWESFGITVPPWRKQGKEIVILAQRGIGGPNIRQPRGWPDEIARQLRKRTDRPIRIRQHPGPQGAIPAVSLEDDLRDAYAAVTWGSAAGIKALALGVPVFYGLNNWIGAQAAKPVTHNLEDRFIGDPLPMFHRLAWAMWSLQEIESGEAIKWLTN